MSKLSFKNLCAIFMIIAFILFVVGSPSEVQAQSQEKLEKTNSISSWLVVGALALTLVVVIVTVSKGDKKGKDEGEKKDTEAQLDFIHLNMFRRRVNYGHTQYGELTRAYSAIGIFTFCCRV